MNAMMDPSCFAQQQQVKPQMIELLQRQVEITLEYLDDDLTLEYRQACALVPELVVQESKAEDFLRARNYNTLLAAQSLVKYWKLRKHLFGPDDWLRPMTQKVLTPEELHVLRTGYFAGGGDTWSFDLGRVPKDTSNFFYPRVLFYILTAEAANFSQGIHLLWNVTSAATAEHPSPEGSKRLLESLPIKVSNVCVALTYTQGREHLLDYLGFKQHRFAQINMKQDVKYVAAETPSESLKQLTQLGCSKEWVPQSLGGDFDYSRHFVNWLAKRQSLEDGLIAGGVVHHTLGNCEAGTFRSVCSGQEYKHGSEEQNNKYAPIATAVVPISGKQPPVNTLGLSKGPFATLLPCHHNDPCDVCISEKDLSTPQTDADDMSLPLFEDDFTMDLNLSTLHKTRQPANKHVLDLPDHQRPLSINDTMDVSTQAAENKIRLPRHHPLHDMTDFFPEGTYHPSSSSSSQPPPQSEQEEHPNVGDKEHPNVGDMYRVRKQQRSRKASAGGAKTKPINTARDDYLRKRNAMYARRFYHKRNSELQTLQNQVRVLQEEQAKVRQLNQFLQAKLAEARLFVAQNGQGKAKSKKGHQSDGKPHNADKDL